MSKIHGTQLNSIDLVFKDKIESDSDHLVQGLLQVYGQDNDITYLITKIKLSKDITVDRDVDGHLTWKIGDKELKIGSSFWSRTIHAIKSYFSKDYRNAHHLKVSDKITHVVKAYTTLIKNEIGAENQKQEVVDQEAAKQPELKDQNNLEINQKISSLENEITQLQTELDNQTESLQALSRKHDEKVAFLEQEFIPFQKRYKDYENKADLWNRYLEIKTENSFSTHRDEITKIDEALAPDAVFPFEPLSTSRITHNEVYAQLRAEKSRLDKEKLSYCNLDSDTLQSEVNALKDSRTELENAISDLNTLIQSKCDEIAGLEV